MKEIEKYWENKCCFNPIVSFRVDKVLPKLPGIGRGNRHCVVARCLDKEAFNQYNKISTYGQDHYNDGVKRHYFECYNCWGKRYFKILVPIAYKGRIQVSFIILKNLKKLKGFGPPLREQ